MKLKEFRPRGAALLTTPLRSATNRNYKIPYHSLMIAALYLKYIKKIIFLFLKHKHNPLTLCHCFDLYTTA